MTALPVEPPDTGAVDALNFTLADLAHALKRLDEDIIVALNYDDDLATVVRLLDVLRHLEDELGKSRAEVEQAVVRRMPTYMSGKRAGQPKRKTTVADFQVLVRGGGEWKEWNDSRVAFAVCGDLITDVNGEAVPELAQHLALFRDRLLQCGSVTWRTTELQALGVDPANYATRVDKRHTVQLIPVVDEQPAGVS